MGLQDQLRKMSDAALRREMNSAMASITQAQQLIATLAGACAQGDNDACEATEEAQQRLRRASQMAHLVQAEMVRRSGGSEDNDEGDEGLIDKATGAVRDFFGGLVGELKDMKAAGNKGRGKGGNKGAGGRGGGGTTKQEETLVPKEESSIPEWVPLAGAGLGVGALVALIIRAVRGN